MPILKMPSSTFGDKPPLRIQEGQKKPIGTALPRPPPTLWVESICSGQAASAVQATPHRAGREGIPQVDPQAFPKVPVT